MKKVFLTIGILICITACKNDKDGPSGIIVNEAKPSSVKVQSSPSTVKRIDAEAYHKVKPEPSETSQETQEVKKAPESVEPKEEPKSPISTPSTSTKAKSTATVAKKQSPPKKKKPKPKYPIMTFDSLVHRMPDVVEGDVFKHKFKFKNTGNAPLSITGVDAACGCTVPSFPFLDIAPGDTGEIGVEYHSVTKHGPQKPEITIMTNAKQSETVIAMTFTVFSKEEAATRDSINKQ